MEKTRNDKSFFYVFPTLKVEEDIQILFADVEVKKITTNSRRDFLHVHIFSRHLIQKKQIWQMERRIKDQLFGNVHVEVRIEEEYALSGQYTPEALINEYRESIILELKEQSVLASREKRRYLLFLRIFSKKDSIYRQISALLIVSRTEQGHGSTMNRGCSRRSMQYLRDVQDSGASMWRRQTIVKIPIITTERIKAAARELWLV